MNYPGVHFETVVSYDVISTHLIKWNRRESLVRSFHDVWDEHKPSNRGFLVEMRSRMFTKFYTEVQRLAEKFEKQSGRKWLLTITRTHASNDSYYIEQENHVVSVRLCGVSSPFREECTDGGWSKEVLQAYWKFTEAVDALAAELSGFDYWKKLHAMLDATTKKPVEKKTDVKAVKEYYRRCIRLASIGRSSTYLEDEARTWLK